jgi:hypothetical protein
VFTIDNSVLNKKTTPFRLFGTGLNHFEGQITGYIAIGVWLKVLFSYRYLDLNGALKKESWLMVTDLFFNFKNWVGTVWFFK